MRLPSCYVYCSYVWLQCPTLQWCWIEATWLGFVQGKRAFRVKLLSCCRKQIPCLGNLPWEMPCCFWNVLHCEVFQKQGEILVWKKCWIYWDFRFYFMFQDISSKKNSKIFFARQINFDPSPIHLGFYFSLFIDVPSEPLESPWVTNFNCCGP